MPIKLNGETYYWTAEACRLAGTTKNTFLRWVREGTFTDVRHHDRRGWRLFTEGDLARLKTEINRVYTKSRVEKYNFREQLEIVATKNMGGK